jgi:hypothetical protein
MAKQEQQVRMPPPKATGVMRLQNVKKGKLQETWRLLMFGVEGIGKTSFGASMPKPIFIDPETGSGQVDAARFPTPQNFNDVLDAARELRQEKHEYLSVIVDTVDWIEPLIWKHICVRDRMHDIEQYGFGKGFNVALEEWRILLRELEALEREKGMNVLLLGHSAVKTFKNPEGPDFDRYEPQIHAKAAGVLKQWPRAVLFAHYEQYAEKENRYALKAKGFATGERLLFTNRTAAYDAKNRYDLPASVPLSWDAFVAAATTERTPAEMIELITVNAKGLPEADAKKVLAAIERAAGDVAKLKQLNNTVLAAVANTSTTNAAEEN